MREDLLRFETAFLRQLLQDGYRDEVKSIPRWRSGSSFRDSNIPFNATALGGVTCESIGIRGQC